MKHTEQKEKHEKKQPTVNKRKEKKRQKKLK